MGYSHIAEGLDFFVDMPRSKTRINGQVADLRVVLHVFLVEGGDRFRGRVSIDGKSTDKEKALTSQGFFFESLEARAGVEPA